MGASFLICFVRSRLLLRVAVVSTCPLSALPYLVLVSLWNATKMSLHTVSCVYMRAFVSLHLNGIWGAATLPHLPPSYPCLSPQWLQCLTLSHLLDLVDRLRCFCSNLSPTVKWMHLSILWLLFPQLWEFVGTEHSESRDIQDYQSVVFVLERMPSWICNFCLGLYLLKYFKYLKEMLYWLRAQVATV